jgi:uncharacterized protein YbaP (TraB family)
VRNALAGALAFAIAVQGQAQSLENGEHTRPTSPGPALWQVSNGDHHLWIFGTLTPLSQDIDWRSEQVESVIAQSQEYIYVKKPEIKIPANPFKLVNGMRLVYLLRYNPGGKTLKEVVPADLYSRYAQLLAKYPLDDMENVRPYFAADGVRGWAIMNNALTEDHGVDIKIAALVEKNPSIKTTPIPFVLDSIDYDFLSESFENMNSVASLADEIHCLEASVESIENDIPGIQARARAWEAGDIAALHDNRNYQQSIDICQKVYLNLTDKADVFEDFYQTLVNAAEQALHNNRSTFATVDIDQLISPEGLLERLRAKGYPITEP